MTTRQRYKAPIFPSGITGSAIETYDDVLSPAISMWDGCPLIEAMTNHPDLLIHYFEDFTGPFYKAATNGWILTQATAGTGVYGNLPGGTLILDAGDTTAHHGVNLQLPAITWKPAANKALWFEARFQVSDLGIEFALGLADLQTAVISAGALAAGMNFVGFSSVTGDGVILPQADKAGTAATITTSNTLVAATYVKMGFILDGLSNAYYYVNNVLTKTVTTGATNIPVVGLTPTVVCQNASTTRQTLTLDWIKIAQMR